MEREIIIGVTSFALAFVLFRVWRKRREERGE